MGKGPLAPGALRSMTEAPSGVAKKSTGAKMPFGGNANGKSILPSFQPHNTVHKASSIHPNLIFQSE